MKKGFIFLMVFTFSLSALSQKGKVTSAISYTDQGMLDKAKEAIDQAQLNESTMNWTNTYLCQSPSLY